MCYCELGSIPIVVALSITTQPTMRQPLSDYIRYIYVHHKTLSSKAVGFRYWISRFATAPDIVKQDEGYPKEMTKCPLCNIDLEVDDIRLESHLSDLHGNLFEVAKALTNILERLEQIERNIEKSHGPIN